MRLPTEAAASCLRSPSPSRQSRTDESTPSRRSRADFCFRKAAALREYDRARLALDAPIRSLREIHGGPVRRAQMSTISGNRRKEEKGQRGERNSLATGSGHSPRTSKTATSHVSDQLEWLRWKAPARQPGNRHGSTGRQCQMQQWPRLFRCAFDRMKRPKPCIQRFRSHFERIPAGKFE